MNRWVLAATTSAMLAALAGCNSDSDNDDAVVEPPAVVTPDSINLSFLGRYSAGIFAESAAEIPAFDPVNKRIFIVNAQKGAVDVLDASDPANPTLIETLTATGIAADAVVNSIAYKGGYLAVAIEASPKTDNGYVALYDATTLELLGSEQVGAQPDMLAFSPDGKYLLTANEGEPSNDYSVDPVGSISILSLTDDDIVEVRTATFSSFNARRDELVATGVRIFGPGASVEQDLEPEYIAISDDSSTAWVALQENNALAKIDIASATVTDILPLGYKDHGVAGNGIDASDEDGEINITTWPGVLGMYQPDAIAAYSAGGSTYLVAANEGDARAWGEDDDAYTDQAMGQAILDKRYDLQYILYLLALHRLLKARLPGYDYDQHIGGAVYLFLRGVNSASGGAFTDKPPRVLIEQLDALFDGEPVSGEVAA